MFYLKWKYSNKINLNVQELIQKLFVIGVRSFKPGRTLDMLEFINELFRLILLFSVRLEFLLFCWAMFILKTDEDAAIRWSIWDELEIEGASSNCSYLAKKFW